MAQEKIHLDQAARKGAIMVDVTKARQVLKAVLELHAGHINHTQPMTPQSLQREMDLLQEAYNALGGDAKGAM